MVKTGGNRCRQKVYLSFHTPQAMTDRILSRCLWLIIMTLIAGSAVCSLILIYAGFFRLITRQFEPGGIATGAGLILAAICYILCRNADDLIDRRR